MGLPYVEAHSQLDGWGSAPHLLNKRVRLEDFKGMSSSGTLTSINILNDAMH